MKSNNAGNLDRINPKADPCPECGGDLEPWSHPTDDSKYCQVCRIVFSDIVIQGCVGIVEFHVSGTIKL